MESMDISLDCCAECSYCGRELDFSVDQVTRQKTINGVVTRFNVLKISVDLCNRCEDRVKDETTGEVEAYKEREMEEVEISAYDRGYDEGHQVGYEEGKQEMKDFMNEFTFYPVPED